MIYFHKKLVCLTYVRKLSVYNFLKDSETVITQTSLDQRIFFCCARFRVEQSAHKNNREREVTPHLLFVVLYECVNY